MHTCSLSKKQGRGDDHGLMRWGRTGLASELLVSGMSLKRFCSGPAAAAARGDGIGATEHWQAES